MILLDTSVLIGYFKGLNDLLIAEIAIENDLFLFHNDYTNIAKIYKNLKIY